MTFFNFGFFCPTFGVASGSRLGALGVVLGSNPAPEVGSGKGLFVSDSKLFLELPVEVEPSPVVDVVVFRKSSVLVEFEIDLERFLGVMSDVIALGSSDGVGGIREGCGRCREPEGDCDKA